MTNEQRRLISRAVEGIERIADSLEDISENIAGIREENEGGVFFIDEDMEVSDFDGTVFGFGDDIGFMCDSECGSCGGGCGVSESLESQECKGNCGGDHECSGNCGGDHECKGNCKGECTAEEGEEKQHNCYDCGECGGHEDTDTKETESEEGEDEITEEEVIIGIGNAIEDILGIFGITQTGLQEGRRKAEKIIDILTEQEKPKKDIGCIELVEADLQEVKERIKKNVREGYMFEVAIDKSIQEMLKGKGITEIPERNYNIIKELIRERI